MSEGVEIAILVIVSIVLFLFLFAMIRLYYDRRKILACVKQINSMCEI